MNIMQKPVAFIPKILVTGGFYKWILIEWKQMWDCNSVADNFLT